MNAVETLVNVPVGRRRLLAIAAAGAGASWVGVSRLAAAVAAQDLAQTDFLESSAVHDVTVTFEQAAYDAIVDAYRESGDKEWMEATVTINGETFEQVGLRLKGNSSLMGLRGDTPGFQEAPDGASDDPGGNRPVMGGVSADEPEGLPWLIRLDEFVDDQHYNGLEQFVVRSNNSQTSLNEAVALELLTQAGLASQKAAPVRFVVNDSQPVLRLAIENPKNKWMKAHFPADGLLFKSESEGDWSYLGPDYESYVDVAFDLEAGDTDDDAADYQPLIEFLDFLNNADDETFNAELPERLSVDQFAVYLAMMDLIRNDDDIDGPGNNSYLYWSREEDQFTVVPWDMNLAFGGFGAMGGGPAMTFPGTRDGALPDQGFTDSGPESTIDGTPVAGFPPDANVTINGTPSSEFPPNQMQGDPANRSQGGGMQAAGGPNLKSNPLVERFKANEAWSELVTSTTDRLRAELFEAGVAANILERWSGVLRAEASDLVAADIVIAEADAISTLFV